MTPTSEELEAGQKAYQRFRLASRYIPGTLFGSHKLYILTMIFGALCSGVLPYESFRSGDYVWGGIFLVGISVSTWQWFNERAQFRKDVKFLAQLKVRFGPGIYTELEKEPTSLFHAFFRKLYSPDRERLSVRLP